jgi:hypothetical protein
MILAHNGREALQIGRCRGDLTGAPDVKIAAEHKA